MVLQPSLINLSDLVPGCTVFAQGGAKEEAVPITLAALFRTKGQTSTYGLVSSADKEILEKTVVVGSAASKKVVGSIQALHKYLPAAGKKLAPLFSVLVFDPGVGASLSASVRPAAYSKNFSQNVFGGGRVRVRKARDQQQPAFRRGRRVNTSSRIKKGVLVSNVVNPAVRIANEDFRIARGGIVSGRRRRPFAGMGEGGMPVLSSSNALMGFVIGRWQARTLIIPAEDVVNQLEIEFLTPNMPPRPGLIRHAKT
jgi:hypothetical protein